MVGTRARHDCQPSPFFVTVLVCALAFQRRVPPRSNRQRRHRRRPFSGRRKPRRRKRLTCRDFEQLAARGDAQAQYQLGLFYAQADVAGHDDVKAVDWWQKAADQALPDANSPSRSCTSDGRGVAQDTAVGLAWCHKAARAGVRRRPVLAGVPL